MGNDRSLARILDGWARRGGRTERIRFTADPEDSWSIGAVLYALWDHDEPISNDLAHHLGLPVNTSVSQLARLLWTMCDDERFPCTSHGEAVRHLHTSRNAVSAEVLGTLALA